MATNVRTEMRIPTRAAPPAPGNIPARKNTGWRSGNDVYGGSRTQQPPQKKKPPPRPPPPKFIPNYNQNLTDDKLKKPARPTELLTNLFGRKHPKPHPTTAAFSANRPQKPAHPSSTSTGSVSLIDLSPPGSPTFNTRSSSDGVSVDSFGSDGNSNPSAFTSSSGNTSQTDSAFEDDFDFFDALSSKKPPQNDPWRNPAAQDPFSPIQSNPNYVKQLGNASTNDVATACSSGAMPTIIRARPTKAPVQKSTLKSLAPVVARFDDRPTPAPRNVVGFGEPVTLEINGGWNVDFGDEPSPPMPSIPAPAPPPEYLEELEEDVTGKHEEPFGIALYDFPASQADDLPLKEGDIVYLVKAVNDDWLEGRVGNRQGMFPANFVEIKVPLACNSSNTVTTLYPFKGETWEDLSFEAGAEITVLSRISGDWLYGECGGFRGQFPANYVSRVPANLPQHS